MVSLQKTRKSEANSRTGLQTRTTTRGNKMKKLTLALIAAVLIFSASDASARGYSSRSYSSRSYSSRSYSRPPVIHNHTTIIHRDSGSGSLMPFALGMMMGHNSNPQPQTVIVDPQQVQPGIVSPPPVVEQAAVSVKEDDGIGPFGVMVMILAAIALVVSIVSYIKRSQA